MRRLSRVGALTLLAILGILLVFFCPASSGPFTVTNGPATAFRAMDAARGLFAAMNAALLVASLLCVCHLEYMTRTAVPVSYNPELFALRC
jgi:hypothetical protein